jgi:predicted ATP-binding protein involved in virulence
MELIYLWVENYKNIEQQGFNFSPRFKCEYDKNKNELTINENKDYVSIFPDNINITSIVGENGSGKSALFEKILGNINVCIKEEDTRKGIFLQCYYSRKEDKVFIDYGYFLKNQNIQINAKNIKYEQVIDKDNNDFLEKDFFYHYKNHLDYPFHYNKYASYSEKIIILSEPDKYHNTINLEKEDKKTIKNMLYILSSKYNYINTNKFFVPSNIEISFNLENKLKDTFYLEDGELALYKNLRNRLRDENNIKYLFLIHIIFYLDYILREFNKIPTSQEFKLIGIIDDFSINGIDDFIKNIDFSKLKSSLNFQKNQVKEDNHISIYENSIYLNEIENTLKLYENIEKIVDIIEPRKNPNMAYEIDSNKLEEKDIQLLISLPDFINIDFRDISGKHFSELSSGEKNLLRLIYSIINIINLRLEKKLSTSITLLLDEIENTLHPNWQKKILNYLITLGSLFDIEVNIIITSHSPFILSDLPKENIIFLEKGVQKQPFKENEQTFGANIHTLLSHGFFMSDGLMGEFAKSKISEIKKFYELIQKLQNKGKIKKELWKKYLESLKNVKN